MAVAADYALLTQQLYLANLWRPADYHGLAAVSSYLAASNAPTTLAGLQAAYASNSGVRDIVNNFSNSAESQGLYGTVTDVQYVGIVYQHLLNRDPDLAGLDFWATALQNKVVSRATVAAEIIAAASKAGGDGIDNATVANKLLFASYFATTMNTPERIAKYSGDAAAAQLRALEQTVGAASSEGTIQAMVDGYWNPPPIPVVTIAAETHLAVAHADGIELIGASTTSVLI